MKDYTGKYLDNYSGYDQPSFQEGNEYAWMSPAFSQVGNWIGQIWGPIGGQVGKAVGRDAGMDFSRLLAGDDFGKVGFDRLMTAGSKDPFMGTQLPGSQFSTGILGPLGKSLFGWK